MGSILTNTGAMTALQTLKGINKNLGTVQDQISTGLKVGKAKDDAAVWAISQVMRADQRGFEAISEALSLGSSTVAVASSAAKSIGDALEDIKVKIVSAQQGNVDKGVIQQEIESLTSQIEGIVKAAQFNGQNLLDGSSGTNIDILSSLDRNSGGSVTSGKISVDLTNTNLTTDQGTAVAGFTAISGAATLALGGTPANSTFAGGLAVTDGAADGEDSATIELAAAAATAGNVTKLVLGTQEFTYIAKAGDDVDVVAYNLRDQIANSGLNVSVSVTAGTSGELVIENDSATQGLAVSGSVTDGGAGALTGLKSIDVTTDAASALGAIETMIKSVTNAQATLGTSEKRLEIQSDFMSKLTDSFKTGIGTLVDADMEEAAARLQALQVQQQLGTQSLSIANQAPQSILSLFR